MYNSFFLQDLQGLMDPSRNMAKYRSLINSEHIQPPMVSHPPLISLVEPGLVSLTGTVVGHNARNHFS